ncbi:MAG: TIGR04255 family protein [Candidatus Sumerlaeota bacterium]
MNSNTNRAPILESPPVVEVAITVHFLPSENAPSWSKDLVFGFFDNEEWPYSDEKNQELRIEGKLTLPNLEKMSRHGEGKLEQRLKNVLRYHQEQTFSLEVGQDYFTLTSHRRGRDYPGFSAIMKEWEIVFQKYVSHFEPDFVSRISLIYIDNVPVHADDDKRIELKDYFHFRPEYPDDDFGDCVHFEQNMLFPVKGKSNQALAVSFQTMPKEREDEARVFRIVWQYIIKYDMPIESDSNVVKPDLAIAKSVITNRFQNSFFTEKAWSLFKPIQTS